MFRIRMFRFRIDTHSRAADTTAARFAAARAAVALAAADTISRAATRDDRLSRCAGPRLYGGAG